MSLLGLAAVLSCFSVPGLQVGLDQPLDLLVSFVQWLAQATVFTLVSVLFQLIDLGSPLIHLSPEADKENVDSPLLKF